MKTLQNLVDEIIDLVHENTYPTIEEWEDEDGAGYEINLSPKPELYDKLRAYLTELLS